MKNFASISLFFFLTGYLPAQISVSGTVTNTRNEPLAGVSVQTRNSTVGTTTDHLGYYQLLAPSGADTLLFSVLAYQMLETALAGRTVVDVVLQESAQGLAEVVVVGFGTQNKRQLSGAIASAGQEVFEQVSVPVFQRALQGQLSGLVITNTSGGLNAESVLRVRGVGSISANNQPLIVLDGLILSDLPGSWTMGYTTNPLIGLNANDIASVEVLKDAAAAAVYGSRGSNGVILLSTKNGAFNQPPKVSIGFYAGFSTISKRYDLLNGNEYAALFNAAVLNAGADSSLLYTSPQPSVDWQDVLLRKGFVQESNASVSGGSATNRYFIGATFREEDSYLRTIGLKRYSFRANFEQKLSDKVALGLSFNPSRVVDQRAGNQWLGSPHGWATIFPPNVEAFDANGKLRRDEIITSNGWEWGTANPGVVLEDQWILTTSSKMLTNAHLNWAVLPKLSFRSGFGIEFNQEQESRKFGKSSLFGRPDGWATELNQQLFNYNWTNQLSWKVFKNASGVLDAMLGMQLTRESFRGAYADAGGFAADRLISLGDAVRLEYADTWTTESAFAGYFSRVNYAINNKYFVEFAARLDGSSRFGPANRFGFFPALSAAWVVSDEAFFPSKFIEFLKVRSSFGWTGNAGIGDFAYRSTTNFEPKYNGQPGFVIQSIANQNLGWEKNRQWNTGLDFVLWNNRLRGALDFFIKDTKDLLLEVPVPATNGISFILQNVGAVRNSGLEFSLAAALLRGAFQWEVQLNGATLKNKILELHDNNGDGLEDDLVRNQRMLYRKGESIGSFYLVEYAGVNPANGDALFFDLAGTASPDNARSSNRKIVGKSIPGFSGGFTNIFRFRNFDLSAFFHFKTGHKLYLEQNQFYIENNMLSGFNQLKSQMNAWTETNRITDVPEARYGIPNGNQASTRYLKSASFLRLNHLAFGYTFAKIGKGASCLRVFVTAQNLWTFTAFSGLDPDAEFYPAADSGQGAVRYNLPAAKTYTAGFQIDF